LIAVVALSFITDICMSNCKIKIKHASSAMHLKHISVGRLAIGAFNTVTVTAHVILALATDQQAQRVHQQSNYYQQIQYSIALQGSLRSDPNHSAVTPHNSSTVITSGTPVSKHTLII
jgi:hypothetical protein